MFSTELARLLWTLGNGYNNRNFLVTTTVRWVRFTDGFTGILKGKGKDHGS